MKNALSDTLLTDLQRQKILLPLLVALFYLASCGTAFLAYIHWHNPHQTQGGPDVANGLVSLIVLTAILGLLILVCKRKPLVVALLIITALITFCFSTILDYGVVTTQPILMFALIILLSGALTSTGFTFCITLITIAAIAITHTLHTTNIRPLEALWTNKQALWGDAITLCITLLVFFWISWLFNRETKSALSRALLSEETLRKERDQLEETVEKRTETILELERQRRAEMQQWINLGMNAGHLLHDLANPVTALNLQLESLYSRKLSLSPNHPEKIALETCQTILELIKNSRAQITHEEKTSLFSVHDVIKGAIDALEYKARLKKTSITFSTKQRLNLYTNKSNFYKIILNILSNALESTALLKTGSGKVAINYKTVHSNLIVSISDNGPGLEPSQIPHIFEAFYTTKSKQGGSGMGLSIVKKIVQEELHGHISIESKPYEKTTFTIKIPIPKQPA